MEPRRLEYTPKGVIIAIGLIAVVVGIAYYSGLKKAESLNDELTLLRESKTLQDSAVSFASLIIPENAIKFDSVAIYSRISEKYRDSFKFNNEDTLKNAILNYSYVKNKISILKIMNPFFIKSISIEKDDEIYNVNINMKTLSYRALVIYFAGKSPNDTYENIYDDKEICLQYKLENEKYYCIGFNY